MNLLYGCFVLSSVIFRCSGGNIKSKIHVPINDRPYLQLVEVAQACQAPVHVLHYGHEHKPLAEEIHVARPVLHLAEGLLRSESEAKKKGC